MASSAMSPGTSGVTITDDDTAPAASDLLPDAEEDAATEENAAAGVSSKILRFFKRAARAAPAAKKAAVVSGSAAGGAAGGVAAASAVGGGALNLLGFTSVGPAAGSYAAAWMSSTAIANGGGIAAGSWYAAAQSAAMGSGLLLASPAVLASGAVVGGVIGGVSVWKLCQRSGESVIEPKEEEPLIDVKMPTTSELGSGLSVDLAERAKGRPNESAPFELSICISGFGGGAELEVTLAIEVPDESQSFLVRAMASSAMSPGTSGVTITDDDTAPAASDLLPDAEEDAATEENAAAGVSSKILRFFKRAAPAAKKAAVVSGSAAGGAAGGVAAASAVGGGALNLLGFTSVGPAAGSYAAAWMSSTAIANGGGIAAGSWYAAAQSAAMGSGLLLASPAVLASGAVVGGVIGGVSVWKLCQRSGESVIEPKEEEPLIDVKMPTTSELGSGLSVDLAERAKGRPNESAPFELSICISGFGGEAELEVTLAIEVPDESQSFLVRAMASSAMSPGTSGVTTAAAHTAPVASDLLPDVKEDAATEENAAVGVSSKILRFLKRAAPAAKEVAVVSGSAAGGAAGDVAAASAVGGGALNALGFTSVGPAAGSYAAARMSSTAIANGGGIAAGLWYAAAQSAAMGSGLLLASPTVLASEAVVGGVIGGVSVWKLCQRSGESVIEPKCREVPLIDVGQ